MPVLNAVRALMPVVVTIVDALITRRVVQALCAGIIVAALIATNGDPIQATVSIIGRILDEGLSLDHIYTLLFLLVLGGLIELLTHSGGLRAYTAAMSRWITSRRRAESASLLLSSLLFIDDYLNSLMVGAIMRPITDRFRIPRVKLAYLINSMSASLCVVIPASSWVAMSLAQLQNSGVSLVRGASTVLLDDPYGLYCLAIPCMFYPLFSMLSAAIIAGAGISYGPMASAEKRRRKEKDEDITTFADSSEGEFKDLALPLAVFMVTLLSVMLFTGDAMLLGGERTIMGAFQQGNPFLALFCASIVSFITAAAHLIYTQRSTYQEVLTHLHAGAMLMKNSCIILILAWTFGSYLRHDLQTGEVLAHIVLSHAGALMVPLFVFIAATTMTAATGSAWGTIAILVPLVVPLVVGITGFEAPLYLEQVPLLIYALGAIFSGAVAGGHISPLTDASVMAATSARAQHIEHIATQLPYVVPSLCGAAVAYLVAGTLVMQNVQRVTLISLAVGMLVGAAIGTILYRTLRRDQP